jgi:hypothetical protein
MELPIIRSSVKARNKKKGENEGQKAFDDTIVQLSDIHLPHICIQDVFVCELVCQVV